MVTKEELEEKINQIDRELGDVGRMIDGYYNQQDDLWTKRRKYQEQLDTLTFKDYIVDVNACYLTHNDNPSWHDEIYNIVKVLDFKNDFIKYVNYIYRTDDSEERLIVQVKTDNKTSFLRNLRDSEFKPATLEEVRGILSDRLYL